MGFLQDFRKNSFSGAVTHVHCVLIVPSRSQPRLKTITALVGSQEIPTQFSQFPRTTADHTFTQSGVVPSALTKRVKPSDKQLCSHTLGDRHPLPLFTLHIMSDVYVSGASYSVVTWVHLANTVEPPFSEHPWDQV